MWNANGSNNLPQNDFLLSLNGQQNGNGGNNNNNNSSAATTSAAGDRPPTGNNGNDLAASLLFQQQQRQQQQGLEELLQSGGLQNLQDMGMGGGGPSGTLSQMKYNLPQQHLEALQPKVKVKCESCGVLLEVVVPQNYPNPTMIVRCGNCSSLLEVLLKNAQHPQLQSGAYGLPGGLQGMGGMGQLENMSYLQQSKNPLQRYDMSMAALSSLGQMQQPGGGGLSPSPGPSMPFSQYNMLHHPHISFDNMRGPGTDIQEMQRHQNIQMLMNYTGLQSGHKRGLYDDPTGMGLHHLQHGGVGGGGGKPKRRKKDPSRPKKLSLYNKYVSQEVHRLKKSDQKFSYKDMFKIAAASWKTSPMNPKFMGAKNKVLELSLKTSLEEDEDSFIAVELKYVDVVAAIDNNHQEASADPQPTPPALEPAPAPVSPTHAHNKELPNVEEEEIKEAEGEMKKSLETISMDVPGTQDKDRMDVV